MAFGRKQGGANYLALSSRDLEKPRGQRLRFLRDLSLKKAFLQFAIVLVGLTVLASSLQITTLAETILSANAGKPEVGSVESDGSEEGNKQLKKAMEDSGFDPESEKDMEKWAKQNTKPKDKNSFSALFYRVFVPQYINEAPNGYSAIGSKRKAGCDNPQTGKGTIVYHNCDVPNLSAEVVQDIVNFIVPSGAYGAEQESAKSLSPSFGLPTGVLPGNGQVPVKESARNSKYTALEIFGYNLNYTAYLGEWDHVKVFTPARAMSNFGVFDNLKLGGKAIIDGAVGAVNGATSGWSSGWDTGGLAGAIGGFFSGAFEGGATSSINTILDTSDLNVFEQKAWYRPGFASTTYGARSMNSTELSAESLRWMNDMMNAFQPNKAAMPEDFPFKGGKPARPVEAISSCEVISSTSGAMKSWGQRSIAPGVSEANCKTEGERVKKNLQDKLDKEVKEYNKNLKEDETPKPRKVISSPAYKWDEDGARAQETIAEWKSKNSAFISGMSKYGWSCDLPAEGKATERAGAIDGWYNCYDSSYDANYKKTLDAEKDKENTKYTESVFGKFASVFAGWYAAQSQNDNFNAAYNRFVCQDPTTGKDIMDGSRNARVYKSNGQLTGKCAGIRPPIQDGLFGNGYASWQSEPKQDTRRAAFSPVESLATTAGITVAGVSLQISVLATQLSNTVLGLAFTPVLDALGIREIIVSLMESFRDSMFMPLAVLIIAIGAVSILWRAIRSNAYAEGFTSFLYIVAAFLLGVILLAKPAATLKAVDEAPVLIENTILAAMFGDSADDQLCTATGTKSVAGGKQIDGSNAYNPHTSVRVMMCENWRTFAFTPWVHGQWGTGYENLYAKGKAPSGGSALSNTNESLVGNAAVNFGGGKVINNWATYQLAVTSTGTSTTADTSKSTGVVNKNFYRIVDAQMGPNNGAGTDSTYAESWSKFNGSTAAATFLGPVAAIMGAVVVIGYSIAKIELVLVSVLLLTILPIMLLLGIHPTFGRPKLKAYGGTLVGLMIQRILLTLLMGLLFKFLFSISASGASYLVASIFSIIVAAIFIGYRKELLGLVQKTMDEAAGSFAGGRLYDARTAVANNIPVGVRNFASMKKESAKGMAFGAVAAVAHGQKMSEVPGTLKRIRESYTQRESAAQLVGGLGGGQKASRLRKEIKQNIEQKFNRSAEFKESRDSLLEASGVENGSFNENGDLMQSVYLKKTDKGVTKDDSDTYYDPNGNVVSLAEDKETLLDTSGRPIEVDQKVQRTGLGRKKTLNRASVRRNMSNQNKLRERIQRLEQKKTVRVQKAEARALERMGYGNIDQLEGEERVEAQIAKAKLHIQLTRASRQDGRNLDADGNPIAQSRVGAQTNGEINDASKVLDDTIDKGVAVGRFAPNHERKAAQREAYSELKDLVEQASREASEGLRTAADSVDRNLRISETLRNAKTTAKDKLGLNDKNNLKDFGDYEEK